MAKKPPSPAAEPSVLAAIGLVPAAPAAPAPTLPEIITAAADRFDARPIERASLEARAELAPPASRPPSDPEVTPRPTIGRIVHYFDGSETYAAIVAYVSPRDGTLNLTVCSFYGTTFSKQSVEPVVMAGGKPVKPGWYWPPRG